MIKKILFISLLIFPIISFAQIAYYDAITLSSKVNSKGVLLADEEEVYGILSKYVKEEIAQNKSLIDKQFNKQKIDSLQYYDPNPFIEITSGPKSGDIRSTMNNLAGAVGGLNVTNFADGLSRFLIDRARQELNVAFFQRFRDFIQKNPEAGILFPKTSRFLVYKTEIDYTTLIQSLRSAFHDDLDNLLYNMEYVFLLPRYQELLVKFPEIEITAAHLKIVKKITHESYHPADVFQELAELRQWNKPGLTREMKNLHNAWKLMYVFSKSLRSTQEGSVWISVKEFESMIKDSVRLKLYLGLVLQDARLMDIRFYNSAGADTSFAGFMSANLEKLFIYENYLRDFMLMAEDAQNLKNAIVKKRNSGETVKPEEVYQYISTSIGIVEHAFRIAAIVEPGLVAENYIMIVRSANDLYKSIYEKQYSSAVMNAVFILDKTFEVVTKEKGVATRYKQAVFGQMKQSVTVFEGKTITLIDSLRRAGFIKDSIIIVKAKKITLEKSSELRKALTKIDNYEIEAGLRKIKNSSESLAKEMKELLKDVKNNLIVIESMDRIYLQSLVSVNMLIEDFDGKNNFNKRVTELLRYGTFMANVAMAQDAEGVKQAIEAAALPVGSSSLKKYSCVNIALNAYVGGYYSLKSKAAGYSWASKAGIIAPVGVSLSTGFRKAGSLSLFVPLLDVGAIVDFRLNNDSSGIDQKIVLSNIISPGGYIIYGFPGNIPLSLGVGTQYGPGLFKVSSVSNTLADPSWRWNAFLAVDIPILNLYNKQKKVKK